ncbi:hypothetical protein M422DRAFT_151223 [Sphaerobolus stellatus SS14]|nr:hypothetical protein M422DRAFT_151223 [Sphaerobolus stellatus SS14]
MKEISKDEAATGGTEPSVEDYVELAKRAFALRNHEQAVEHYATALEIKTKKYGDASPECVDLYFAYGKALLENAIAQNSVLGKEETSGAVEDDKEDNKASGSGKSSGRIHFGEDEAANAENGEEPTVDLFADASKPDPEEEEEDGDDEAAGGDDDGEPEDDFNAAWEVLEVARSLYETQKDSNLESKARLADTYILLGDVSLETEKLDQAVSDYSSAAKLKAELLPISSRQIAEVHYKLCIVYDMTPGRLAQAIDHARKAEASVQARLDEVTARLQKPFTKQEGESKPDVKGKGKATYVAELSLEDMNKEQLQAELNELQALLEDVSLKIEELKTSPDVTDDISAPELVARELDKDLSGPATSSSAPKQVNDLTSIVKKKKRKAPEPEGASTAEQEVSTPPEKKAKMEEAT